MNNRQSTCEQCGVCCSRMGCPPFCFASIEQAEAELPSDFPSGLRRELTHYIQALLDRTGEDRGAAFLPCFWFDIKSKLCTHYEWRPEICQNYVCGGAVERPAEIPAEDETHWPMKERLWLVCKHVTGGFASEVWCRSDKTAVCRDCAIASKEGDEAVRDEELSRVCPVCLYEQLKAAGRVVGREFLERDVLTGHCHGA